MVITPWGFSSTFMPATNPLRSVTCASTLLPMIKSARPRSATSVVRGLQAEQSRGGGHALR